jgi:hypothetical protein
MIYRNPNKKRDGWVNCQIRIEESNIQILSREPLKQKAEHFLKAIRKDIKEYLKKYPEFAESFDPLKAKKNAPDIIKEMSRAASSAEVGPMAAVAGAVAQKLAEDLKPYSQELIIENGGDIFFDIKEPLVVGLWSRSDRINDNLGLLIKDKSARAVCTSSGTLGHSFSHGKTDAATVIADNAALADAWATRLGNEISKPKDINKALKLLGGIKGLKGALVICRKTIALWGKVELTQISR